MTKMQCSTVQYSTVVSLGHVVIQRIAIGVVNPLLVKGT